MNKTGEIPYSWEEMEAQIKDAIRCQASILESFGPCFKDCNIVMDFLGLPRELYADLDFSVEYLPEIDLKRHILYDLAEHAYRYAYQLDGWWNCEVNVFHDVDGILQGYPQADADGERSPLCTLNDFPLRRMFETFFARYGLFGWDEGSGMDLSIRELSLLANMTVPAVRTSLSKEGFKLERVHANSPDRPDDKAFKLNVGDAKLWLSRRRGFIPQRIRPEGEAPKVTVTRLMANQDIPFNTRVDQAIGLLGLEIPQAAATAQVDLPWLSELVGGKVVEPDIDALRALARIFGCPEPGFAGAGVEHLLTLAGKERAEASKERTA